MWKRDSFGTTKWPVKNTMNNVDIVRIAHEGPKTYFQWVLTIAKGLRVLMQPVITFNMSIK